MVVMKEMVVFSLFLFSLFTSCSPVYYQVFEAEPTTEDIMKQTNALVYEDENCRISYDFWDEYGDMSFRVVNKTEQMLYLDLGKSFFVLNSRAYDYYQQRVFSFTSGTSVSSTKGALASKSLTGMDYTGWLLSGTLSSQVATAMAASKSNSVSILEKQIICIPAHTSKRISEFSIYDSRIRDCDLLLFPKRKEVSTIKFTIDNSPVVFENRLVYRMGDGPEQSLIHRFFVSGITNMHKNKFIGLKTETFCGQEGVNEKEYFKFSSPDKFYISYEKTGLVNWKH